MGRASAPRRRASRSTNAASSRSTARCAPTCRTSSPSATSSASRCSPTRPRTRARSRRKSASGHKALFDAKAIPSVAYTDPEVAWVGVTETEAKAKGIKFGKAVFPWAASGRSLSLGRDEGLTKTLWDEETKRLIGCGIVGPERRRPHRRGGAGDRNGRRRRRHRPHHPSRIRRCRKPSPCRPRPSPGR